MRNILLPESFDPEKLKKAMAMLYRQAVERSKGQKMLLCWGADCFEDSFNGFVGKDGKLVLGYHWNIGEDTLAVNGRFDIY